MAVAGSPLEKEWNESPPSGGTITLSSSIDSSDEPVYIYDTQGKCRWVNRAGERLLGLDAPDIVGRYIFELFPGQSWYQIKAWRRVIDYKEASSFLPEVTIGGEVHRLLTSLFPVMDDFGRVQSVVSVGRRFVEKEALEYENQMRGAELALIHETASIITSSLEIDEVYERFAAEFKKLVDFDRIVVMVLDKAKQTAVPAFVSSTAALEAVSSDLSHVAHSGLAWIMKHLRSHVEDDLWKHQAFNTDENLAAAGIRSVIRVPLMTRDGMTGILSLGSFQPNAFGERAMALAERMAAQIAPAIENARLYQESQAYARELEVIDEIAGIITSSLHIEEVYERFASELKSLVDFDRMTVDLVDEESWSAIRAYTAGLDPDSFKSKPQLPLEGSDVQWVVEHCESIIEVDLTQTREHQFAQDESMLGAGFRSGIRSPLVTKNGVIGVFALWSQNSSSYGPREQRILERLAAQIAPAIENARLYQEVEETLETLRSTQEQLVRVERLRAMGELASGVAHDFNNSLAAILGRTQLLMNQTNNESHLKSLQLIEQAAQDSAQVVRRILDFARFDSDTEFSSVDVDKLIDDVVELTRYKWSDEALSRGKAINVNIHTGNAPPARANYSELREVLMNLVINACDALHRDGTVEMAAVSQGDRVCISVSDNGIGMSPEVSQKIFDPFFTTKGASGTGLGLSVAFGIISRHEGTIEVESEEGKGTTILISLPTAPAFDGFEEQETPVTPASSRTANVLIIEDELLIRETLADILSLGRHHVALAADGEEGIALFDANEYDVVFTDLSMPGLSGWEVVKAIKQRRSDVPVIMVTGWGVGIDQSDVDEYGVDKVLPKPFDIDLVLKLVQDLVKDKSPS